MCKGVTSEHGSGRNASAAARSQGDGGIARRPSSLALEERGKKDKKTEQLSAAAEALARLLADILRRKEGQS